MERIVCVQRCQVSAPMASYLAGLFTEKTVQWVMSGIPILRAKWGLERVARKGRSESFRANVV